MSPAPFRVGVYLQGGALLGWEAEAIACLERDGAECVVIPAQGDPPVTAMRSRFGALDRSAGLTAGLDGLLKPAQAFPGTRPVVDGARGRAAPALDFILFFGRGDVPSWLPGCAEHGVWLFTRSASVFAELPFMYDLCRGTELTTFALHCAGHDGVGGEVLWAGRFRAVRRDAREVCAEVLAQAVKWPSLAARYLRLNGKLPKSAIDVRAEPPKPVHLLPATISLLARQARGVIARQVLKYFVLDRWNIGLAQMKVEGFATGAAITDVCWLPPRRPGFYFADPFILSTGPQISLLVEDYHPYAPAKISKITLRKGQASIEDVSLEVCLEPDHHISYPYLFKDRGALYCLPECHQSNRSTLYRWNGCGLEPVLDVVSGARVTDGSIVFDGSLYWLFCGFEDDSDQTNLHLFYAERLDADWRPHPLNPVKTDVASSRSGGQWFVHEGQFYRPAQDCSKSYGSAMAINRIDILTVTEFRETTVSVIRPKSIGPDCVGVHTLSFSGDLVAIDARFGCVGWVPIAFRVARLLRRLRTLAGDAWIVSGKPNGAEAPQPAAAGSGWVRNEPASPRP